jgi:hypothetical protein
MIENMRISPKMNKAMMSMVTTMMSRVMTMIMAMTMITVTTITAMVELWR